MVVAATFLTLIEKLGKAKTLAFCFGFRGNNLLLSFVPETKGCTLEQIEEHLRSGRI